MEKDDPAVSVLKLNYLAFINLDENDENDLKRTTEYDLHQRISGKYAQNIFFANIYWTFTIVFSSSNYS